MPTRTGQPQWRGNMLQRFSRGLVDRILPGNQRGADGTLVNEGRGLLGLGVQVGSGFIPVPGASIIGRQVGTNIANNGNPLNFSGNDTRIGQLVQAFTGNGDSGGVQRQPINFDTSIDVDDIAQQIGYRPELQTGGGDSATDRMARELARIQGQINASIPTMPTVSSRPFGRAAGAFTPFGAGVISNNAYRDTSGRMQNQFGEAAQGFGIGMGAHGSGGSFALADAQRAAAINKV